jgi:hypothetical protein
MKHAAITAVLVLAGCGGNYSNEDLDYQLSLPQRSDLVAQLPSTVENPCEAEYHKTTRGVVAEFRGIVDAFLGLIEAVRRYPPTSRLPDRRIWGPFPNDKHRDWLVRVVIIRNGPVDAPTSFDYTVDFRPLRGNEADWKAIIKGSFEPHAGVRRGIGQLHLITKDARDVGYPLDDLAGVFSLDINYKTDAFPIFVGTDLTDGMGHPASYTYHENQDGSGDMSFTFQPQGASQLADEFEIISRWNSSGVGRGDARVTHGTFAGLKGIDCWGMDTCPTYTQRDFEAQKKAGIGDPASCAFPAP